MRFAAKCVMGLSFYIIISLIAILTLNPSRKELGFAIKAVVIFGGMTIWSAIAAWQIWAYQRTGTAYALVSLLTLGVAIGWLQYGSLNIDEPIHPVLNTLRTIGGFYIVLLWPILVRASTMREPK